MTSRYDPFLGRKGAFRSFSSLSWGAGTLLVGASAWGATPPLSDSTGSAADTTATSDGGDQPSTYKPSAPTYEERGSKGPGLGMYGDILAMWTISPSDSHEWGDDCPSFDDNSNVGSWNPNCDTKSPLGFMLEGRLGFRFGYLGVEGIGLFAGDWSSASFDEAPPVDTAVSATMHVGRIGGGIGGGLRFLTAPSIFRFTLGAGGGVMFRHVYSSVSSLDGTSEGYQAPFVKVDANLVLLHFLSVGFQAYFEFAPTVTLEPALGQVIDGGEDIDDALGSIRVFQGPQIFIGPVVGIHFGG